MACSGGGSEPQLFYTYGCFAPQLFDAGFIAGESHIFKAQEHFPQALCSLGSRHGVFTGAYRGIVILKFEQRVLVNCFLTDGIIWWQPLANGIHNRSCCRDSVMRVTCFSVACIRGGLLNGCHALPPSSPPLCISLQVSSRRSPWAKESQRRRWRWRPNWTWKWFPNHPETGTMSSPERQPPETRRQKVVLSFTAEQKSFSKHHPHLTVVRR